MIRFVILGSGTGSNARAILQEQAKGNLGLAEVVGIFSDKSHANILKLGPEFDVSAFYLNPGEFKTKLTGDAEQHWIDTIQQLQPDIVVLAGFMRVLKQPFIEAFPRTINLHPSLLPKYPGLHSIQRALESGDTVTGCTVHWVTNEVDGGDIIDQARVAIEHHDTLETLTEKVHAAEHQLLPAVIKQLARDIYMNQIRAR